MEFFFKNDKSTSKKQKSFLKSILLKIENEKLITLKKLLRI